MSGNDSLHLYASNNISVEELDKHITETEILYAINGLKRVKASGIDELVNEIFINRKDVLTPFLGKIFNHIFENNECPETWTKCIIVPIPKEGNASDVNNCRGITIMSVFAKLFSTILNNRLMKWAENCDVLQACQFGFHENRSTIDCIYILHSLVDRSLSQGEKVFCTFVDFKSAFDLITRQELWFKLTDYGASSKTIQMITSMYELAKLCVKNILNFLILSTAMWV